MANAFDKTLESQLPGVNQNGLITKNPVDMTDSATVALPAATTINGSTVTALGTITSVSANALAVGRQGTTHPAFNVDSSAATQLDGLNVAGLGAGSGAAVSVITSGTNSPLTIDAAGSGTISLGSVSTGAVVLPAAITIASGATITGSGTGTSGIIINNIWNESAKTLSGTQLTVKVKIGGTDYFWLVSPTAS